MPRPIPLALALTLTAACAAVAPPVSPAPAQDGPALGCQALRGTPQGLLLQMDVPADLPADAVLALYRDDAEVVSFPLTDLDAVPAPVALGDSGIYPGDAYAYTCAAFLDDALLVQRTLAVSIPDLPPRPGAPDLTPTPQGVRVAWAIDPPVPVRVYRRDVLNDGPSEPISPAVDSPGWLDASVEPGGVYAYALQAALLHDGLVWESDIGPERYAEAPAPP